MERQKIRNFPVVFELITYISLDNFCLGGRGLEKKGFNHNAYHEQNS